MDELLIAIADLEAASHFRQMVTPGGFTMSVALTNCGRFGWTSDRHGYRYTRIDPDTNQPWPAMPDVFARLAHDAAADAGFKGFAPDRSEEHTSELQSLMRNSYAVFCLKKKKKH